LAAVSWLQYLGCSNRERGDAKADLLGMIGKSAQRFSEEIMPKQRAKMP
jgi:hypothetical protein